MKKFIRNILCNLINFLFKNISKYEIYYNSIGRKVIDNRKEMSI